jgi:hypothetical protein
VAYLQNHNCHHQWLFLDLASFLLFLGSAQREFLINTSI